MTVYLVRHAAHGLLEHVLAGRMPQLHLAAPGQAQAQRLASHFKALDIAAVHTSPRERAQETAQPIAAAAGTSCVVAEALEEVDTGEWTGASFDSLRADPRWQLWNSRRGSARAPGGESMTEVQSRIVAYLQGLPAAHAERRLVLVSHADVIKAALLYLLAAPLDAYDRFEIAPAGISTLLLGDWGGKVISINERVAG